MTDSIKSRLERLYIKYNQRKYAHPDPIEFLYRFRAKRDREIVALIASALAYGRVPQILKSVSYVLDRMNHLPYHYLHHETHESIKKTFSSFTHRFARGNHLTALLMNVKHIINEYGSLENCFIEKLNHGDDLFSALTYFSNRLQSKKYNPEHLVASPQKGSACKRMNLFLRWMIRKDRVDPGGWKGVSKDMLIIPLDTHMHKIALVLGLTKRNSANMLTALEITDSFRSFAPNDPVKYDFALTRFGIRDELDIKSLID